MRIFVYPLALSIELMFGPIRVIKILLKKARDQNNMKFIEKKGLARLI